MLRYDNGFTRAKFQPVCSVNELIDFGTSVKRRMKNNENNNNDRTPAAVKWNVYVYKENCVSERKTNVTQKFIILLRDQSSS